MSRNRSMLGKFDASAFGPRHFRSLLDGARSLVQGFHANERGNVIILAGILLPVLVGAGGIAVSYSGANSTRTSMQSALDAAVLAGVAASDVSSVQISTAGDVFKSNLNKFALASAKDIAATFTVSNAILYGDATGSVTNAFDGVVGIKSIAAKVSAAATKKTAIVCVLGLNGQDKGSFDINGSKAKFTADCAVQANSTDNSGMTMEGNPTAKAKKFGVSGGHKGDGFYPVPSDGSAKLNDPYASMPFPAHDSCAGKSKGLDIKNDTTLKPGTYCGGIQINGNASVTLEPGIYVMVDGSFTVDGGGTVTGDQVMIGFTGKDSTLRVWGNSTVDVTSPTSGTYMNMQFMQDWADENTRNLWVSVGGSDSDGGKLTFDGVAYFPTQNFWTRGNATINANSPSMAILADKVWTQGSATVNVTNNNPRNLPVTNLAKTTLGVVLIK